MPAYSKPGDNHLWSAVVQPFPRQRDYWRRPDGTAVTREDAGEGPERSRLAE